MATETTDILVGVKGGGSLTGASGRQIEADIKAIMAKIEAKGTTKLTFKADTGALTAAARQMETLQRQMAAYGQAANDRLTQAVKQQETLNRLTAQQLSLQQQAGRISGSGASGTGHTASGGGIGSALGGLAQTISNAAINKFTTDSITDIKTKIKKTNSVGRLKVTSHQHMPTHTPAATRSERAA